MLKQAWLTFCVGILGILSAVGLIVWIDRRSLAMVWCSVIAISFLTVGPIIWDYIRGRLDIFEIKNVFLLFIFMRFTVWPISAVLGV